LYSDHTTSKILPTITCYTTKEKEYIEILYTYTFVYICIAVGDPIIKRFRLRVMVFNTSFNNISAISWRSIFIDGGQPEYSEKTTDLSWTPECDLYIDFTLVN
jgi:hypothetical protein